MRVNQEKMPLGNKDILPIFTTPSKPYSVENTLLFKGVSSCFFLGIIIFEILVGRNTPSVGKNFGEI